MALALGVTHHWHDGRRIHVVGTITASGNYTTGGDTLSFVNPVIKSSKIPDFVQINGIAVGTAYLYRFVPGSTQANGKMLVVLVSTGAELAQAAYPDDVKGDKISFYAIFKKLV